MGNSWFQIRSTVCPRSSDPFHVVTYYIQWANTSWTDGSLNKIFVIQYRQNFFLDVKKYFFEGLEAEVPLSQRQSKARTRGSREVGSPY